LLRCQIGGNKENIRWVTQNVQCLDSNLEAVDKTTLQMSEPNNKEET
jgi:hypothetical protein